ncbi:SDR family NAD(P)-dependent oxidoreductase [Streptomyces sp. NPDC058239]|uniref:SDR family NAD(P)-dependent oxidoreductase n=1 Tax=Streptomyces sp. NPDC058239 TaxID=3346395 RepID=UPI0036EF0C2B
MSDIPAGKVVVVTGAASGIGRAIAVAAARHGAKGVIVADLTETPHEGGEPTVAAIQTLGVPARFVATDVTRRAHAGALVDAASEFDGVDVMVCNAVITLGADGADVAEADHRRLTAVDLDGVLFGAQAAARQMKDPATPGSIVLMAGMGELVGAGFTVAHSTSRGGVILMAKSLADALGPTASGATPCAPAPSTPISCGPRPTSRKPRTGTGSGLRRGAWGSRPRPVTPWRTSDRICRAM